MNLLILITHMIVLRLHIFAPDFKISGLDALVISNVSVFV